MEQEHKLTLEEIVKLLDAEVVVGGEDMCCCFCYGAAADLMSDVLAFMVDGAILLTGLANDQVIRTADMVDCSVVVLVRGKRPTEPMVALAKRQNVTLLSTHHSMYAACGLLFQAGLPPVIIQRDHDA